MVDGLAAAKLINQWSSTASLSKSGAMNRQAGTLKSFEDLACDALSATLALANQVRCHDSGDDGVCSFALDQLVLNKVAAGFTGDHRATAPGIM
ncbi:hypothetical protein [Bradyrhizobium stylosanthis]|uniref:hypothetical protein n=1 Tax=Bradyrhizobium stylosanthis TaxID=1803665 RepID=UPI0007C48CB3|nr:hypothetical protein [Bradyrhizobium stylosanthis]